MYHENSIKENSIIIGICVILYLFSPSASLPVSINEVQAKEVKTASGALESRIYETVSSSGKTDKNSSVDSGKQTGVGKVLDCNADCKIKTLIEIGIREEIAESLVINCKALADDPRKCVIIGASIVKNESSGGWKCRKNNKYNCFGIMQNNDYKSYSDATLHFAGKFQKWWRNANSMEFFYPKRGEYSPSRFCVSEHSSNSSVGCENGLKNSSLVFKKLEKLF